jgi:hypothetical protein
MATGRIRSSRSGSPRHPEAAQDQRKHRENAGRKRRQAARGEAATQNVNKDVQKRWLDDVPGNIATAQRAWPSLKDKVPKGL